MPETLWNIYSVQQHPLLFGPLKQSWKQISADVATRQTKKEETTRDFLLLLLPTGSQLLLRPKRSFYCLFSHASSSSYFFAMCALPSLVWTNIPLPSFLRCCWALRKFSRRCLSFASSHHPGAVAPPSSFSSGLVFGARKEKERKKREQEERGNQVELKNGETSSSRDGSESESLRNKSRVKT